MTQAHPDQPDDPYWRRPSAPPPEPPTPPAAGSPVPGYPGPPVGPPPAPGWRPAVHQRTAPPRQLPAQDAAAVDAAEQQARTMTYGIGLIATAVLVVVVCLLCSRALF